MKHLMLSSALVTVMSFGAMAQTDPATEVPADPATDTMSDTATMPDATAGSAPADMAAGAGDMVPAFLASDFIGMNVHAIDAETLPAVENADTDPAFDRSARWSSSDRFAAQRETWEDIGNIGDVVMTQDGALRGILVDVGGFLGIGARTVMVDIESLYFVADDTTAEELSDFNVVATYSREQLEALPEYDASTLGTGYPMQDWSMNDAAPAGGYADATDPAAAPSGEMASDTAADTGGPAAEPMAETERLTTSEDPAFAAVEPGDLTAEQMIGATVEDAEGNSAGSVEDLVLDDQNGVSDVIVDVGGFLGIGARRVALPIEGSQIMWNSETDELRIQVSMTKEQLEELPEHQG
ncbi:PRC-barrel domain-containing protein [Szabonella alba]|uniref:PRC-barrel domain-containing protein n=1 Tax=Szabonella alba TaxID=2804194 RepID=A0A8K0V7Q2_9RHOB|nr:PRC-barrel domain-containing protein [Szabonella alba]MBL4916676.1 PRC-barrel domain-containing protein [Szabonella alba]